MTAADAFSTQPATLDGTVFLYCFHRICRTTRVMPTASPQKRADRILINPNQGNQQPFHHSSRFGFGRRSFSSKATKSSANNLPSSAPGFTARRTTKSQAGNVVRKQRNRSRMIRLTLLRSTDLLSSFLPTTNPRRASVKPAALG